jgi:hypothetical protein
MVNRTKHVSFNTGKNITHSMVVWSFAYKSARRSNWCQVRADKDRFERRCEAIEHNISYVFGDEHRKFIKYYIERMLIK